jgi:hypothetical protein
VKRFLPIIVGLIALLCICSVVALALSPSAATPMPAPAQPAATPTGYVTRETLGDDWPLTVDDGRLACNAQGHVTLASAGVTYAVNGTAKGAIESGAPYQPIDTIWRDDPNVAGLKVSLQPLLDIGLSLCR